MTTAFTELHNSGFLDYDSYRSTADSPVVLPPGSGTTFSGTINVALVLTPATDPTTLLNENWATRQAQIATMTANNTLWTTYGANAADYNAVVAGLQAMTGVTVFDTSGTTTDQYVSSQASSTIWVQVDETGFQQIFGTTLMKSDDTDTGGFFWTGNLSLPTGWAATYGVQGIEFDSNLFDDPVTPSSGGGVAVPLSPGYQSLGNLTSLVDNVLPQDIAANYYNVPLTGALWSPLSPVAVKTAPIGVIEPKNGVLLASGDSIQTPLNDYLTTDADIAGANVTVTPVANGGQTGSNNGERSLDVSILSAVDPNSDLYVYAGSGTDNDAKSDAYTAYQSATWDTPGLQVLSSSYSMNSQQPAAGSPFLYADQMLFAQAALQNITVVSASGDGGSGKEVGNGVTNVGISEASPYDLLVGGTSIGTLATASADPSLASIVSSVLGNNPATLWQLIAGGLTTLPSSASAASELIETTWNQYLVNSTGDAFESVYNYTENEASTGGVDPTQAPPSYQSEFGLDLTTQDSAQLPGRGVPDVAALAGGDMNWNVLNGAMTDTTGTGGTSAATPFWAALITQINAVLDDQRGLGPTAPLGYMNDLLYIADVIAPGSFNDIQQGNNISSFLNGGPISYDNGGGDTGTLTPTGYGYSAEPGYDLTTGLGSPDGLLLARALSAITTTQTNALNSGDNPDMLDQNAAGGWTSNGEQSLLFQTMSSAAVNVSLFTGSNSQSYGSGASSAYAWTSQFADQVLQPDFDPNLVTMFDKQSQGAVTQGDVSGGDNVAITVNGSTTFANQGTLSTAYGFADFTSGNGTTDVRVADPVMVAQTVGNSVDQDAVIRLRSDGQDSLSIEFYKVDDMNGDIGGLAPGSAGYANAVAGAAYSDTNGDKVIQGPSYGGFAQQELVGVDAGDMIAMVLFNNSHGNTYYEFSQANEMVNGAGVAHVWNYGANTFGWEDTYGGGDHDYNDLVVGVDYTSAAGNGLLVGPTH